MAQSRGFICLFHIYKNASISFRLVEIRKSTVHRRVSLNVSFQLILNNCKRILCSISLSSFFCVFDYTRRLISCWTLIIFVSNCTSGEYQFKTNTLFMYLIYGGWPNIFFIVYNWIISKIVLFSLPIFFRFVESASTCRNTHIHIYIDIYICTVSHHLYHSF